MREQTRLSWAQLYCLAAELSVKIRNSEAYGPTMIARPSGLYGIPTGGSVVATILSNMLDLPVLDAAQAGCVVVDDICDSGATLEPYRGNYTTAVLFARPQSEGLPDIVAETTDDWVVFPYEHQTTAGEEIVTRMLQFIGEDPSRPGLKETPARVVRAWRELFAGYRPLDASLTTFTEKHSDEMIVCRNIEFVSFCEHHILPFWGVAHVAYIPEFGGKILGLSKLARLVDYHAKKLQLQERMTQEIAQAVWRAVAPRGVGVTVKAQHMCVMARGVGKKQSEFVTSAVLGNFKTQHETRAEFMALVKGE